MTKIAKEAAELIDSLPAEKAQTVLDFARYLAEKVSEDAWEKSLSNPKARENFERFAKEALREPAEPLDPEKM
jgi:hypothetical protein